MGVNGISSGRIPVDQNMSRERGSSSQIEALKQKLQQLEREKKGAVKAGDSEKAEKLEKQIQEIKKQIEQLKKQEAKKEKGAKKEETKNPESGNYIDDYA
ncbi:MAG: hypothetical protein HFH53_11410 [Hespellia sp.]|jgi:ATP-dependent Clp protease ATP-binding subunit ClpA|nr:hypothetical protein [Hespellia sp.]